MQIAAHNNGREKLLIIMKVDTALIRVFQFVTFVLFTFMVLAYYGAMLLLPLTLLTQIIRLLSAIGLPGFIAGAAALGAVAYLANCLYQMPTLYKSIIDTGTELVKFGYEKIMQFESQLGNQTENEKNEKSA